MHLPCLLLEFTAAAERQTIPRDDDLNAQPGRESVSDLVAGSRAWYDPHWHYDHETETRAALDFIRSEHFSRSEPGIFAPLLDALLK
jgi:hypothetical protein